MEDQGEEEFAQRIVELAREKRKDGHDDDYYGFGGDHSDPSLNISFGQ